MLLHFVNFSLPQLRVDMKNLLINQTDFSFAVTEVQGLPVPYATAGDCFSANGDKCRRGHFKIDLSGTGLRVDKTVSWTLVSNTPGLKMQDFTNQQGIVISAKCGGWCGQCRPNKPLKLDLITCKVRTSEYRIVSDIILTLRITRLRNLFCFNRRQFTKIILFRHSDLHFPSFFIQ